MNNLKIYTQEIWDNVFYKYYENNWCYLNWIVLNIDKEYIDNFWVYKVNIKLKSDSWAIFNLYWYDFDKWIIWNYNISYTFDTKNQLNNYDLLKDIPKNWEYLNLYVSKKYDWNYWYFINEFYDDWNYITNLNICEKQESYLNYFFSRENIDFNSTKIILLIFLLIILLFIYVKKKL